MNPPLTPPAIDIIYFSWTGNTKKVVDTIVQTVSSRYQLNLFPIEPRSNFPYLIWLLLSFLPGIGTRIIPFSATAPVVILGMPKWTINCPPITMLLRKGYLKGKTVFVIITYRGFDEKRYAECYKKKIDNASATVRSVLLVKRRKIQEGDFSDVREWAAKINV